MRTFATEAKVNDDGTHNYYINIELSSERDFNALRKLISEYWFGYKEPEDCKCVLGELVERNSNTQNKWCCESYSTVRTIEEDKEND